MRNIYNLTVYELLEAGKPEINNGDVWLKQWMIDWCDTNLSSYELKVFVTNPQDRSRRIGIRLENTSDLLLFELRWRNANFELLGPYTEEEMCQRELPK